MPGYLVILFALSLAFVWVEVFRMGRRPAFNYKPLNCVPCLTGWLSLAIAYGFSTPYWYFYIAVGLFAGSMFSALKMRYL